MSDRPKPKVILVGQNGNVFNLLGICTRALKRAGQYEEAQELKKRVLSSGSYDEALALMLEYVDEASGEDCPFGGDTTNDCADCVYAIDYMFKEDECVRREDE